MSPTDAVRVPTGLMCDFARSVVHAVGAMLVRVTNTDTTAVPVPRAATALAPGRVGLTNALTCAAARGTRYGWPFTIVVVRFETTSPSSVEPIIDTMWQRLRAGDELHHYRDDAVALILPGTANDALPQVLTRLTSRVAALHFGVANSPLEGNDGASLLALAEHRFEDAVAHA